VAEHAFMRAEIELYQVFSAFGELIVVGYARVRAGLFQAVRMAYRYPWRPALVGLALALIGWAIAALGWTATGGKTAGIGAVLVVAVTGWWWARQVAHPRSTKRLIERRQELDQRSGGVATMLDVAEIASPRALRLQAWVLRPQTWQELSWWRRRRMNPYELGVLIAALGWGLWRWGQRVWCSIEDATLRIGGPRMGKTISLAVYGLKAPGALLTTSTRLDLAQAVHAARLEHGPVHFFNPAGLGGVPSTVRWRVLDGCEAYEVADRRATDLIPPSSGDREMWDTQARRILALLLHAAALSGKTMRDVVRWSTGSGEESLTQVIAGLLEAGPGSADRIAAIREHWILNDRTKSSITSTIALPLAWMYDDRARELGDAAPDDPALINIRELIERGQTLHLIGHEQRGTISPLIGAFVAEIAEAARGLAADQPTGRLDPPLTMLLDEAAIVVPVPLHEWTADMGGRGVTMHISVHSLAQMRSRWGRENADALLGNIACFIVFGGGAIHDDLADISAITGQHRMKIVDAGQSTPPDRGRRRRASSGPDDEWAERPELRDPSHHWVPVLSPGQLRALEPGQVLVLRRHLHAVVGWVPKLTDQRRRKTVPLPRTDSEALAQLEALYAAPSARTHQVVTTVRGVVGRMAGTVLALWWTVRARLARTPQLQPTPVTAADDDTDAEATDGGQP
jgi:type IV secretion system protein VirD4